MATFNTRGAVDLGALSAQKQNAKRAAAALAGAPAGTVIDVTEADFQTKVLEQSVTIPVIVDLWATWCEPCKQLSPLLERLAAEAGGTWVLAKIDVDANQRLAAAFQVQSIPTVLAVIGGKILPLFQGAHPEAQVRQVLDEVLRVASEAGITGTLGVPEGEAEQTEPVEAPIDPRLNAAYDAIDNGDWAGAERAYRAILAEDPGDEDATAGLATVGVYQRTDGATEPADPTTLDELLLAADFAALGGDWPKAFARGIEAVKGSTGPDRERARLRMVEYFAMAADDPAVPGARTALASALF